MKEISVAKVAKVAKEQVVRNNMNKNMRIGFNGSPSNLIGHFVMFYPCPCIAIILPCIIDYVIEYIIEYIFDHINLVILTPNNPCNYSRSLYAT